MWSDNPVRDAERYAEEQEDRIYDLPVCSECGKHIQEDHYYTFGDECICPDCEKKHLRWI